jgi:hypothetical protein
MKTLIILILITIISSFLYSQSNIVYDTGTTIDIGSGSDVCADTIIINGTQTGIGTFCNAPVVVESDSISIPDRFELSQNFPNPFNPSTTIRYSIPLDKKGETRNVLLKIYDVLGNEIVTLVNEKKPAGMYSVQFTMEKFSSGIYFYKLTSGDYVQTKKMILLK